MLKKLKDYLKKQKDKDIFDIVIYGSAVKGKIRPNDVDVLVIFRTGSLRERLDRIQKIKDGFDSDIKIDIKALLLEELLSPEFFGRTGVFIEGVSVFEDRKFSERLGFVGVVIFTYNMKDKDHTEKVKFNYILSGRGKDGLVKMLGGRHLSPGTVEIPIENSDEFESVLKLHKIDYRRDDVLKGV